MTYLPDKDSEVNKYVTETELKFHSVLTFSESHKLLLFDDGDYVYSYLKLMDKRSFFPHLATNNLQGRLTGFSCNATNWCGCWRQYCCAVEEPVPSENNDGSAWFARWCFCSFSIAVPRQGASAPQTAFPFDIINGDDDVADDGLFDGGNSSSNNWRSPVRRLQCSSQQAAMR